MQEAAHRAVAIVGAGALLPDARNVNEFWENIKAGRYSISDVPPGRWDPALYYDPDPAAPDKTYSKIGGWVRQVDWDPFRWHLPLPPRVVDAMDDTQKWAIACTRQALEDYGYPNRTLDADRTAVILGNAMAGEKHYLTSLRVYFPEYARELSESSSFAALPSALRADIERELHERIRRLLPEITEDSMPGELANCIAGRVANLFNFHGPNFVTDAACASAMAAVLASVEGLIANEFDVAITGGMDHNMGAPTFVKFCKIGALSATGSRPFAEGADGFVMGEGGAVFVLKRLADAERDGDKIYAVIRGIGGASDGKGKGITAPNPIGQKLAIERAWQIAGEDPRSMTMMEAHGTSTRVGDVVEVESANAVLAGDHLPVGSIALGSVKSNIGHLKGAAGAAGLLKVALALRDRVLPPSVQCEHPNPQIDFAHSPLRVNSELRPWTMSDNKPRRASLSAFGFGGTNFHAVLEEYVPFGLTHNGKQSVAVHLMPPSSEADKGDSGIRRCSQPPDSFVERASCCKNPLRGVLVSGAASVQLLAERLRAEQQSAEAGRMPALAPPAAADLRAEYRIAIDFADNADLKDKIAKALKALANNQEGAWKALRPSGVFFGHGPAPKVAFLYTGQGSQYVNMFRALGEAEPIVADAFAEADRVMTPLLGKPLTEYIFVDEKDPAKTAQAEADLMQTAITQPAVLTADLALTRLLGAYGIEPDMTMGHSLGEYGALVAAGSLPFEDALLAVSARGREMTRVSLQDHGKMAAVFAPIEEIERMLQTIDGYVVIANVNSNHQAVIGGSSVAVDQATQAFLNAGYNAVPLPVSHAFHTSIVAPASEPLRQMLGRLHLSPPRIPVAANVDGEFYPTGPDAVPKMLDILGRQIASPVQFIKGLHTLYAAGARVFVEIGPKKALQGFAADVLGDDSDVLAVFTNHPKNGDVPAFNQALCGLYAMGLGSGIEETRTAAKKEPVGITGAALGLPGKGRVFDDANLQRILSGEQCIGQIPANLRDAILDKNITRLVKSDNGGPVFEQIKSPDDVLKLAGRAGDFDLGTEFGVPADRISALERTTQLAIAAGIDALRDAGIPLVMRYKNTTKGTQLPDRWQLPEPMRDETGVIFASAFPGCNAFAEEAERYYADRNRREQLALLEEVRAAADPGSRGELDRRIRELRDCIAKNPYTFDRRFIFRILPMGHSQFAEYIGARGPNTQVNAACASTTQAFSIAKDWIEGGRCRRVVIISADDITTDSLIQWMGAAFLASGAAATDSAVEEAALPFDRRRHGMIIGMGAAALVVESAEAARDRGVQPICELLSAVTANSAFHGTRLDPSHISSIMERLVAEAEVRGGVPRERMAEQMAFVSHETYTPARGGSAGAEVHSLRKVFGKSADQILITNTKGYTGHAMATGIEDVVAVKLLETGVVPPVANFKETDPELGPLNLSKGGQCPVEYALRLGAGFGSQIAMALLRWTKTKDGERTAPAALDYKTRIAKPEVWASWLTRTTGKETPELEVVKHTLRVQEGNVAHALVRAASPVLSTPVPSAPQPQVPVEAVVLEIVAAKTGYPAEMLALDLDLEADLGVDTVKQAEVFAAIRERYGIERDPNLRLRDFPTLAHVMRFVQERTRKPEPVSAVMVAPQPSQTIEQRVLAIVSEKTGYPIDMLALDLDLEADLGIDTVKQAEMFAAIRETYGIARDPNLKLRDFPTLAHVVRFATERSPAAPQDSPAPAASAEPAANTPNPADASVEQRVLEIVAAKTGYPKDMLDLDLDLEADLGIDTVKQAEMFAAIREAYGIVRDPNLKLRDFPTLAHVVRFATDRTGTAQPSATPVAPAPLTELSPKDRVLDIVAEKTGYPKDMLDLDLDLEADLGIDTVKQAEMFAAIREAYGIARDPNLKLRDFPTLAHVVRFATDRTATPQPSAPPIAPPPPTGPSAKDRVLDIVAEKTGYPRDMLDLDLDLEADLGIDTVKQAEMFAAIREAYGIVRDPNLKLRDFPTLAHVIRFAEEGSAAPLRVADSEPAAPPAPPPASFEEAERVVRRVPVPVLRPPLARCKLTGVALNKDTKVAIMPDQGRASSALASQLAELGVEVVPLQEAEAGKAVDGIYWLPALDPEGDLLAMGPDAWRHAVQLRVKSLYTVTRSMYDRIATPGTFLISATRLGGLFGYDEAGATAPLGGAVAGFCKAYKRERPEALVKVVDFEMQHDPTAIAEILIGETLRDPGAIEIGRHDDARYTIGLEERRVEDGNPDMQLDRNSVFVITGAAGSIVSAITADLAAASGGTFYLLDLAPEPDPGNRDIERFATDKDALKRDLFARIQARGERATPVLVERELAALERAYAARAAITAVRAAGGTARYFSVNLTDAEAVARIISKIREQHGRVDVLLHAAGLDRSRTLDTKEPRDFDLVFDVKADGCFNLMRSIGTMPLGAFVAFSSIAGRFGNFGQTDYCAANDLLCKIVSNLRTTRPQTRALAIDWTAWGGMGMAMRGSIPQAMERAGIQLLRPEAGIPWIRRELTAGGGSGEVVVAQGLGVLLNEWDEEGGIDQPAQCISGPMIGQVAGMGIYRPLTVQTNLDPAVQPFLFDHRIDGTAVLPGVMGLEAFAEVARWPVPSWNIESIEAIDFLAPFKFYRDQPRQLTVEAAFRREHGRLTANCRLTGSRALPNQPTPQVTTHFTARVRITKEALPHSIASSFAMPVAFSIDSNGLYRVYFHGPAYRVIQNAAWDEHRLVAKMTAHLPKHHHPAELPLSISPRLIELCFQAAGLWEMALYKRLGLPLHAERVSLFRTPSAAADPVYAVVTPGREPGTFDVEVVDGQGNRYLQLTGYRTALFREVGATHFSQAAQPVTV